MPKLPDCHRCYFYAFNAAGMILCNPPAQCLVLMAAAKAKVVLKDTKACNRGLWCSEGVSAASHEPTHQSNPLLHQLCFPDAEAATAND